MLQAVWKTSAQSTVMPLPQQEELPPGLPLQPEPPQVPHSKAQQTEPDATPVLQ